MMLSLLSCLESSIDPCAETVHALQETASVCVCVCRATACTPRNGLAASRNGLAAWLKRLLFAEAVRVWLNLCVHTCMWC